MTVGYTIKDLNYEWTSGHGVNIATDMKLSQFDLISAPTGNSTMNVNKGKLYLLIFILKLYEKNIKF